MTYATPTAADYGIQLTSPNGEIFYDTRNAVANSSFNLTNFSEVGSVAGYYGTIYSGTDYLNKYVDSRPLFGFFRQMSGAAESIGVHACESRAIEPCMCRYDSSNNAYTVKNIS